MAAEVGQDAEFLEVAASMQEVVVPSNRKRRKKKKTRATDLAPEKPVTEPGPEVQTALESQQSQSEWQQFGTVAVSVAGDPYGGATAARARRREQEAYDRELSKRRRQRAPADELLFHSLGRSAYCWKVFERSHPRISAGAQMLVILAWRVLYIMDWASDLVVARDVNMFNSHYGGFLGFLLFVPYAVCAVGMYFPAMKELPIIALKRGLRLQGREGIKFVFVCTALPLAFVADAWLTFRFLLWPTRGYYERAFVTMRKIIMMIIDSGLTTILQLQILSSSISGVHSQLLVQAIVISMLNCCVNGIWLHNQVAAQHKPWFRFIMDAFRVGMSAIPGLDAIRDGSVEVEILSGIEHQSQLAAVGQAMIDAGPDCKVQQLTVQRCNVSDAGVHALLSCLDGRNGIAIQKLNLEHNEIMDGGMSYLASTSLMLKSVICLQLAHNRIGDSGIQDFCARMRSFECLAELDLRWNPLSEASAISISKSLKHNRCRLRLLDLSFTAVGDAGVASIAHALRTNSTLQTLRLNNTNAAEEAAIALTAACQVNTALTELAIAGNPFNDVGGVCFWEIFTASHPTLRFLSLSGCGISDVSARIIAENIAFCQSLTELDLSFNRIGREVLMEIREAALAVPNMRIITNRQDNNAH